MMKVVDISVRILASNPPVKTKQLTSFVSQLYKLLIIILNHIIFKQKYNHLFVFVFMRNIVEGNIPIFRMRLLDSFRHFGDKLRHFGDKKLALLN